MKKFEARLKALETEENTKDIVYAVYHFHPEKKLVYRNVGQYKDRVEVYMDFEKTMNLPFTTWEVLLWLPDEYEDHEPVGTAGWFEVCVGGVEVINENN